MYDHSGTDPITSAAAPLRVAVATRDGKRVDQHFGQAETFLIYDLGADGIAFAEQRLVADHAQGDEDPRDTICRMLADCKVLLIAKIGATPQERLAGIGIEATDMHVGKPIDTALADLWAAKSACDVDAPVDASQFRLLHAMLRVSDLDASLDFYVRRLGMTVLDRRDHKKNQFTQVYLGYGGGFEQMALELVFNWTRDAAYAPPESFGHIAIQVTGITALCDQLAAAGVTMPRPPRAQRHGENIVAFVEDPDGHRIELVQLPQP